MPKIIEISEDTDKLDSDQKNLIDSKARQEEAPSF